MTIGQHFELEKPNRRLGQAGRAATAKREKPNEGNVDWTA